MKKVLIGTILILSILLTSIAGICINTESIAQSAITDESVLSQAGLLIVFLGGPAESLKGATIGIHCMDGIIFSDVRNVRPLMRLYIFKGIGIEHKYNVYLDVDEETGYTDDSARRDTSQPLSVVFLKAEKI